MRLVVRILHFLADRPAYGVHAWTKPCVCRTRLAGTRPKPWVGGGVRALGCTIPAFQLPSPSAWIYIIYIFLELLVFSYTRIRELPSGLPVPPLFEACFAVLRCKAQRPQRHCPRPSFIDSF
uniref:Uncharacterized protein n=1 Tax=Coccidioides posadasii RMSCC 3488 TaxID=454284 RepID=A0A0J6FF19_COCPO|nr:hypothetical protein CPAG_03823 [Coccidioides posadasii RMSCC 3488]